MLNVSLVDGHDDVDEPNSYSIFEFDTNILENLSGKRLPLIEY